MSSCCAVTLNAACNFKISHLSYIGLLISKIFCIDLKQMNFFEEWNMALGQLKELIYIKLLSIHLHVCQDYHLSKGRGSLVSFLVVCSCFSNLDENKACVCGLSKLLFKIQLRSS